MLCWLILLPQLLRRLSCHYYHHYFYFCQSCVSFEHIVLGCACVACVCYHHDHLCHSTQSGPSHLFFTSLLSWACMRGRGGRATSPTFLSRLQDPWPLSCCHGNWPICLLHMKVRAQELESKCETGSDRLTDRYNCKNIAKSSSSALDSSAASLFLSRSLSSSLSVCRPSNQLY